MSHGTLFATAFDLHRFDMLRALHYRLPTTAREERTFNKQLTKFLQGRHVPHAELARHEYDHSIYDEPVAPQQTQTPGEEPVQEAKKDSAEETATAAPSTSSEPQNQPPQGC